MDASARTPAQPGPSRKRLVQVTALAWLAAISVDLLLVAGLLPRYIDWQHPCLLPPMKAFLYIPLGYVVFLAYAILVVWLIVRVGVLGAWSGLAFGTKLGAVIAGAGSLGMASMLTLPYTTLLVFCLDGLAVFSVAGAVIGSGLAASRLRPLTIRVVILFLACLAVIIVLQSFGLAPAGEVRR